MSWNLVTCETDTQVNSYYYDHQPLDAVAFDKVPDGWVSLHPVEGRAASNYVAYGGGGELITYVWATDDSPNKLIDDNQNFTSFVEEGVTVVNTEDYYNCTYAKVVEVIDDTTLELDADIMDDGDEYEIRSHKVYIRRTSDWGLETVLNDPNDTVTSIDWSPDAGLLAVGSADGNVYTYYYNGFNLNEVYTESDDEINVVEFCDTDPYNDTPNLVTGDDSGNLRNYRPYYANPLTQTLETGAWDTYDISATTRLEDWTKYIWVADSDEANCYQYDQGSYTWEADWTHDFWGGGVECVDTKYVLQSEYVNATGMIMSAYNTWEDDRYGGSLRVDWGDWDFEEFDSEWDAGWPDDSIVDTKLSWDARFAAFAGYDAVYIHNARSNDHSRTATIDGPEFSSISAIDFSYKDNWFAVAGYNGELYIYEVPRKDLYIKAETASGTEELNVEQLKNTWDDNDYPVRLQVDEKMCGADTIDPGDAGDSGVRIQVESDTTKSWKVH